LNGQIDFGAHKTKKSDIEIKADNVGIKGLTVYEYNLLIEKLISREVHKVKKKVKN